jgi:hypothetical protein
MFCAPGLIFDDTEGVPSRFQGIGSRTYFRRYRGRRVSFSCFAQPNLLLAVPWASGPVFIFCASGLVFGGTEGVKSRFHVFRSRTYFRRFLGRQIPFSYIQLPDMFLAVPRASGPVFIFCAPGHVFGGTEGFESRVHVLCNRTHFRRYQGRQVTFSCFVLLDSLSAVPRSSVPVFMFFAPELAFGGTEGVSPVFMFCTPRLVFDGTEGVGSRFHVLRSRTRFGSTEGVMSHFHALRSRTRFRRYRGRRSRFHVLRGRTNLQRYRGRPVPFSCFELPNSFSAVPRESNPIFLFFAPRHVFGGTEGVGSRFHILHSLTHFRRYRGPQVPFSCFERPDSISAVPRASGPVFMFYAS